MNDIPGPRHDPAKDAMSVPPGDVLTEAPLAGNGSPSEARGGAIAAAFADRFRNSAEVQTARGQTQIADEVVEKVAGIAARSVEGVFDLGGDVARVFSRVRERIGLGEGSQGRGVHVHLDGRRAEVDLTLVVEYGYVVLAVADAVRANVINAIEKMLGLEVVDVDIVVDDVQVSEEEPERH